MRRIKLKAVQIDEKFEDHRRKQKLLHSPENLDVLDYDELSEETITALEKEHLATLLKQDEMERRRGFEQKSDFALFPYYDQQDLEEAAKRDDDPLDNALDQMTALNQEYLKDLKKQAATGQFDTSPEKSSSKQSNIIDRVQAHLFVSRLKDGLNVTGETDTLLTRHGVHLDKSSDSYHQLLNAIARAKIKALEAIQARHTGDVVDTPKVTPVRISDEENPKLSKAILRWRDKYQRISTNQLDKKMAWYRQFIKAFGDKKISEYLMKDARGYVDALDCLPSRYDRIAGYKRLNIVEAAKKAKKEGFPSFISSAGD